MIELADMVPLFSRLIVFTMALVAQTAIDVDIKSGLMGSRACALSHLGKELYFQ